MIFIAVKAHAPLVHLGRIKEYLKMKETYSLSDNNRKSASAEGFHELVAVSSTLMLARFHPPRC